MPVVLASVAVALVLAAITGIGLHLQGHGPRPHGGPARVAAGAAAPARPSARKAPAPVAPRTAPAVVATSTTSGYATYTIDATSLDVSLATSGPCWVELRNGSASGPVVYQGTLPAGAAQSFHLVAPIWLRLGDPAGMKLVIDGAPVTLPATSNPFDVAVTAPTGT